MKTYFINLDKYNGEQKELEEMAIKKFKKINPNANVCISFQDVLEDMEYKILVMNSGDIFYYWMDYGYCKYHFTEVN